MCEEGRKEGEEKEEGKEWEEMEGGKKGGRDG